MKLALWKKSFADARWLLAGCMALVFGFHWLRVWLISQLPIGSFKMILKLLPGKWESLSPVPFDQLATSGGRLAAAYDEPVVLVVAAVWAIARGSDAVSGELGRGTLEMVLAQPVSRRSVLWINAGVTLSGALLLAVASWLGACVGVETITLEEYVPPSEFIAPAVNYAALIVFLAGASTLASSCQNVRSHTIGLMGAFFVIEVIVKMVSRAAPGWQWLSYFTFLTPYDPQLLVAFKAHAWSWLSVNGAGATQFGGLSNNGLLIGIGLAGYIAAAEIFQRRDLPAPL